MTEQINKIVLHLKERFTEIHSQLVAERNQSDSLKNKMNRTLHKSFKAITNEQIIYKSYRCW